MPGYFDEDTETYGQETAPKALREALEKANKDKTELEKRLADLQKANDDLAKQVKSTSLRDAMSDAGLDPKYARFAERDEVEPNVDSVKKWAEDNKDVYAFLAPRSESAQEPQENADPQDQVDDMDPDMAEALGQAAGLQANGKPVGSATITDVLASTDVSKFRTREELNKFLDGLGAPRDLG